MDIIIQPDSKGAKPQMPSEPPKEVKEMTFSPPPESLFEGNGGTIMTDNGTKLSETPKEFTNEKTKETVVEQGKKAEDKVVEQPKKDEGKKDEKKVESRKEEPKSVLKPPTDAPKKDEKVVEQGAKGSEGTTKIPTVTAPITPPTKEKDDFDYTGYSQSEVTNLKNMSRQSRDWVAGLVKEKKTLEPLKDSTYLQHEQAYTLNPEYQQMQQSVRAASVEGEFWREQALNIKAGKPFRDLLGFKQDGSPQVSDEKQPSDADEMRVMNNYTLCTQEAQRRLGKLQEYPTQFKSRITADLGEISKKRGELFAWVQNPQLMDHSVEIEGRGDVKLADLKKDFLSLLPLYHQSNPIAQVAADLFIGLQIRNAELREARKTSAVASIQDEEQQRAEPTSDTAPSQEKKENGKIPSSFGAGEQLMESLGLR